MGFLGYVCGVLTLVGLAVGGLLALIGGALAVTLRDPIYAVLSLIKAMIGLAVVYFTLSAEYLGAIQVIVYAGAILVTFLFVVMLINLTAADVSPLPRGLPLYGALLLSGGWMVTLSWLLRAILDLPSSLQAVQPDATEVSYLYGPLPPMGKVLFTAYAFPFELLSVTLLVGLVGAALLAKKPLGYGA